MSPKCPSGMGIVVICFRIWAVVLSHVSSQVIFPGEHLSTCFTLEFHFLKQMRMFSFLMSHQILLATKSMLAVFNLTLNRLCVVFRVFSSIVRILLKLGKKWPTSNRTSLGKIHCNPRKCAAHWSCLWMVRRRMAKETHGTLVINWRTAERSPI